ncbi:MAG: acyl-CoA thioesterase [Bacillaceae bacterium]|nr:acyl-CoA thioesterase [Bacillaceae bacterium]
METATEIIVRPTELDVLGHVNNAKYLEYLEWGREEWYEKHDLHFDVFTEMGLGTVTANININYRKEVTQGERLTVKTRPLRRGRTSYVIAQEIFNASKDLVADAEVTLVIIDLNTRQSSPLPEKLARLFP